MNANLRNFALWVIIVLLLLALFTLFQNPGQRTSSQDISFSQLLTEVDAGHVRDVVIQGPEIHGTFTNNTTFQTYAPNDPSLVSRLYNGKVCRRSSNSCATPASSSASADGFRAACFWSALPAPARR
jgi:cell division protease FtsH